MAPTETMPLTEEDKDAAIALSVLTGSTESNRGSRSTLPVVPAENTGVQATEPPTAPAKPVLTREMAPGVTGFDFSAWKKWRILLVVFWVQISMNWNAAIFGNAEAGVKALYHLSGVESKLGGALFLLTYAVGCEFWAPFSEEFGRKWILFGSLALVNLWQIPAALAPSHGWLLAARTLGGLSSAGGSVTLGMVADMWSPEEQQLPLAFVVLSSVAGSAVAPVLGGLIQAHLELKWVFWISLIFGMVVMTLHFFLVPETRTSVLLDMEARRRRKVNSENIWGPGELRGSFWSRCRSEPWTTAKDIGKLMWRPYYMLCTEWIVGFLSLLSGFSDMLVFLGLSAYNMVMAKFGFGTVERGLAFNALLLGYVIAYVMYLPVYWRHRAAMRRNPAGFKPEKRLTLLTFLTWLMPIGLFGFAFCTLGPAYGVTWPVPLLFMVLIGIANYAIYGATIDYMVAAYGTYAASATGGNGFARDFLAGLAMLWTEPFYTHWEGTSGEWAYVWPTLILFGVAALLCIPVVYFWVNGEKMRHKSPMAREAIEMAADTAAPAIASGEV